MKKPSGGGGGDGGGGDGRQEPRDLLSRGKEPVVGSLLPLLALARAPRSEAKVSDASFFCLLANFAGNCKAHGEIWGALGGQVVFCCCTF